MKAKFFFLTFVFIVLSSVLSLADVRDSLLNLLPSSTGEEKVNLLFKLSEVTSGTEEALKYADDAISVAQKINNKLLAEAYINKGYALSENYMDEKAIEVFHKALDIAQKYGYQKSILDAYKGISTSYYYIDSFEQSQRFTDTLLQKAIKLDSLRYQAYAYFRLGKIMQEKGNGDSALAYINRSLQLRKEIGDWKEIALTYNGLGRVYFDLAQYDSAISCYQQEVRIKEKMGDQPIYLAIAYLNLGRTHIALSNFQLALEQYQKALRTFESINHKEGIATCNSGLGMIYENLSQSILATDENETNFRKALGYHKIALNLFHELQKKMEEGQTLQNIGNVYSRLATNRYVARFGEMWEDSLYKIKQSDILTDFDSATVYYHKALSIFNVLKEEGEIAKVNTNLGSIFSWAREWNKANRYINKALQLARKNKLLYETTAALYAKGESLYRQGNLDDAELAFIECSRLSEKLGLKETLRYSFERLSRLYEQKGDLVRAYAYFKKAVRIKDEIFTEKSQRVMAEMQTKYETEKKEQQLLIMKNQDELQKSIIQRQKLMIIGAIIGSFLILMVALLMFKMFRDKQRANIILEEKNALITRQKQEITDSIKYASRIQNAVLPTSKLISDVLPEHFVLFMPRDIVSGDFYWMTHKNEKVVLVAADCTGHGVPGAFMSMLGVSFLYEIVNKENILQPAEILNNLRNHIKTTLSQTGKLEEQKDGMDISLCVIDKSNQMIEWAGAYNPLYQIRNGELIEYKADKMPVAIHLNDFKSFTNHEINYLPGDTFYMFSDGYADQFGGPEGRKFMVKRLKRTLLEIHQKPMQEQREILEKVHLDWRGVNNDQIDDILIVGFRV
ncbi:tetratricopeptide repeat protein [Tenuifilum thalassicum]|uniref:Tetratricopeptide repeat protein n=1 Tax=Tenuifilum thalassicum TaxID=2590900 RepID=A0A7D4C785_9BACT|nr:tetratricopeptide repeat protein [Tenuifilum thalassicum]QKG78822.1 tetratricopeptide repeat protein [Tenuifilum thalassicum]